MTGFGSIGMPMLLALFFAALLLVFVPRAGSR
jgi:hypothetical protein